MGSLFTWKVILPFKMSLPYNISYLISIKFYIENRRKKYICKILLKPRRNATVNYWGSSLTNVSWPESTELRKDLGP